VLGPHHPEVIATLLGLALLYKKQKRYRQAIALLLPIVAKQQNGSMDPAFQVLLLHFLADLYARQEEYAKAEDHFQRALTLWQQTQSPAQQASHPSQRE
jgi:tetratricopeptide (TPR) repeat protein